MSDNHLCASLSPRLLARKGSAKPAMRRPDALRLAGSIPGAAQEDLGWNDWGHADYRPDNENPASPAPQIISKREMPQVLRQIEQIAWRINQAVTPAGVATPPEGRRSAFTLRLDAERHFRLRMAGVVLNRSAQVLVTEALDKYLSEIPEVAHLRAPPATEAEAGKQSRGA